MVLRGASGDWTRRRLVPARSNLGCDGRLSGHFAVLGVGRSEIGDAQFRAPMSGENDGRPRIHTRKLFDRKRSDRLIRRVHFSSASIRGDDFTKLTQRVGELDPACQAQGNVLFYFAMAPRFFGPLCDRLHAAGFQDGSGWE